MTGEPLHFGLCDECETYTVQRVLSRNPDHAVTMASECVECGIEICYDHPDYLDDIDAVD